MIDRETFIRLAREAGFVQYNPHSEVVVRHSNGAWQSIEERLDMFAALVSAHEREQCARIADAELNPYPPEAPVSQYQSGIFTAAEHIAKAIRARSST